MKSPLVAQQLRRVRPPSPEPERRNRLAADHVVEVALARAVAGRAGDDHQRQQVLLARMAGARRRRLVPGGEPRLALGRRRLRGLVEPSVEGADARVVAVAESVSDRESSCRCRRWRRPGRAAARAPCRAGCGTRDRGPCAATASRPGSRPSDRRSGTARTRRGRSRARRRSRPAGPPPR